jgi:RNase P/RNase MRP subunit p30
MKILKSPPKHLNKEHIIAVQGVSDKVNRASLSTNKVDILIDPHQGIRKDNYHQRNSGLNQVLLKLAKENKVAIGFSFKTILNETDLGRIIQNIKLCRKYKVKMVILELEERNEADVESLFKVLGMTGKEILASRTYLQDKLKYKKSYVMKGVKLVT